MLYQNRLRSRDTVVSRDEFTILYMFYYTCDIKELSKPLLSDKSLLQ